MSERPFTNTVIGAIVIAALGGIVAGVFLYEYNEVRREGQPNVDQQQPRPAPATEPQAAQPLSPEPTITQPAAVTIGIDGSTTWRAGYDGVEVEWNRDGSVRRVSSRYTAPVRSPDAFAVRTALTVAEEKAKGAIVRFMEETVSSRRIVTQVESDLSAATESSNGSVPTATRQRTLVTSLVEVTESFASGELRGVVVLESGYDQTGGVAWVVVGIDQKTIGAARAVQKTISGDDQR